MTLNESGIGRRGMGDQARPRRIRTTIERPQKHAQPAGHTWRGTKPFGTFAGWLRPTLSRMSLRPPTSDRTDRQNEPTSDDPDDEHEFNFADAYPDEGETDVWAGWREEYAAMHCNPDANPSEVASS